MVDYKQELEDLLSTVIKEGASDLHLVVGKNPILRISGALIPLVKRPMLTPDICAGLCDALLGEYKQEFDSTKEIDFSYSFKEKTRFRVNIYIERGNYAAALRLVPAKIRTLEELNLPPSLKEFAFREQGLFLVVGPTGHGKSATLASMIDIINHERAEHIVTIEDPIEYLFEADRSIISQREVRSDTKSFSVALRSMFRQDINVAMVGEMRDSETVATAVTAAETGHLILSSLHTNSASQTIDRVIDSFPGDQQNQIRMQLADTLIGIFSQRLIPRISGGLIPAYELLIADSAVRNIIREKKTHEIDLVLETSSQKGMVSLERSLVDLVGRGEISLESARTFALNAKSFELLMKH